VHPELFHLPFLDQPLRAYGVLVSIAFIAASLVVVSDARRASEKYPTEFADLAFYSLLIGLLGSRVLFIIVNWQLYAADPMEILRWYKGGLVFYGGFLTAMVFAIFWCRRNGHSYFKVADRMVLGLALGHVFGRLGCYFAGCCFGRPTSFPFGVIYPNDSPAHDAHVSAGWIEAGMPSLPVHASPLYEAAGELLFFFILLWFRPKKRFDGQMLLLWLAMYAVLRSLVELTRGDIQRGFVIPGIVSTSQAISLGVSMMALVLFFRLRKTA
jgi:phosphatidylglycerol---prolipoprotein diacylglyceryl transferase